MSVTLFHCPKCNRYTKRGAIILVEIRASINAKRGGLTVYGNPLKLRASRDDIIRSHCPDCDGPTELYNVDECPHRWSEYIMGHPPYRICSLCDERQDGRVVFDEEVNHADT